MITKISKIRLFFERNLNTWATLEEVSKGTGIDLMRSLVAVITNRCKDEFEKRERKGITQYRLKTTQK